MMHVTLLMAMSANGFIARPNGEEDFLSQEHWKTMLQMARRTKCLVWGRKTHEAVRAWGPAYFKSLAGITVVVVTRDPDYQPGKGFWHAPSPKKALNVLERKGLAKAVLSGGATLNTAFAKQGLIDEVVLNIEPVLIGKGIPLLHPDAFEHDLSLSKTRKLPKGIVQLRYRVNK